MKVRLGAATLRRSVVACCAVLLLLTPAGAQTQQPASFQVQQNGHETLRHYVGAVPATPADYPPITGKERLAWFARSTGAPRSLIGGLFSAGLSTAVNSPYEYGPHWQGFGKRYGMRLTGLSTENAMEASLGAAWGEDPRYFHTVNQPFGTRVKNILDLTFRAYRPDGERHFAYARLAGNLGSNFLSNTWRAQSEADWQHALFRTAEGIGGTALSNAFSEFVPAVWKKFRHVPFHPAGDGSSKSP